MLRNRGKGGTYLKDRWKGQLDKSTGYQKTQAGKNRGREQNRWEVEKGVARSVTDYWESLSKGQTDYRGEAKMYLHAAAQLGSLKSPGGRRWFNIRYSFIKSKMHVIAGQ